MGDGGTMSSLEELTWHVAAPPGSLLGCPRPGGCAPPVAAQLECGVGEGRSYSHLLSPALLSEGH